MHIKSVKVIDDDTWIETHDEGLFLMNAERPVCFRFSYDQLQFNCICQTQQHGLLFGSTDGIYRSVKISLTDLTIIKTLLLEDKIVIDIHELEDGGLLVVTKTHLVGPGNILYRISPDGKRTTRIGDHCYYGVSVLNSKKFGMLVCTSSTDLFKFDNTSLTLVDKLIPPNNGQYSDMTVDYDGDLYTIVTYYDFVWNRDTYYSLQNTKSHRRLFLYEILSNDNTSQLYINKDIRIIVKNIDTASYNLYYICKHMINDECPEYYLSSMLSSDEYKLFKVSNKHAPQNAWVYKDALYIRYSSFEVDVLDILVIYDLKDMSYYQSVAFITGEQIPCNKLKLEKHSKRGEEVMTKEEKMERGADYEMDIRDQLEKRSPVVPEGWEYNENAKQTEETDGERSTRG